MNMIQALGQAIRIPELRRKHPGITILMYKDASAVVKEAAWQTS